MHIVVMGCGRVGSILASKVAGAGHSVAIIDKDPEAFRRLRPSFSGVTITGVGFDREVLRKAGTDRAAAFAAVSSGDNSNIISARVARETFGVQRVIARIYDSRRAEVYERLGIPTVATVRWAANQMLRSLLPDSYDREIWRDDTSSVALIQPDLHPGWVGHPLQKLEAASRARVAYLTRFGSGTLPAPDTVIQEGDQVFFLATDEVVESTTIAAGSAPQTEPA